MSRIGRPSCEPPFAGITQVRLLAVDSDIAALSARFPELPRMFGDTDATAKAARGQARRPGRTGSICFAQARSRLPHLRMRSPRLRRRLALPRYSVASDAQRGSLTLAPISGFARLAAGSARQAEYASRRWLPRASSGSQLDPVPSPN